MTPSGHKHSISCSLQESMNLAQSSVFNSSLQLRREYPQQATRQAGRNAQPSSSVPLVSAILLERERELQDRLHRVKNDLRLIAFTRATTKNQSTRRACLLRAAIHSRRRRAIESRLSHVQKMREDAIRAETSRNEARRELERLGSRGIDEELDEVALREGWNQVVDEFEELQREVFGVSKRLAQDWSGIDDTELEEELDQEMKETMGDTNKGNREASDEEHDAWNSMQNAYDAAVADEKDGDVENNPQGGSEVEPVLDLLPERRWEI